MICAITYSERDKFQETQIAYPTFVIISTLIIIIIERKPI
jgi:hypothetical protein